MAGNVQELRPGRAGDSEKITINLGYVDLGHIDLMVQEGFYSNRTDFIRTAIRNQLDRHGEAAKQSVARKGLELGLRHYTPPGPRGRAGRRRDAAYPGAGARQHRRGRHARARQGHHRLGDRAGGASRQPGGQGRPGRPHRVILAARAAATRPVFSTPRRGSPVRLATPTRALLQPGCLP